MRIRSKLFGFGCAFISAPLAAADTLPIILAPSTLAPPGTKGDVVVRIVIAPTGDMRCSPVAGLSDPAIRRTSCVLLADRDVFLPDFGKDGNAVSTIRSLIVRWGELSNADRYGGALPVNIDQWLTHLDYPTNEILGGATRVGFTITKFGRVKDCRVTKSSRYLAQDAALCPLLVKRAMFLPALSGDGVRIESRAEFQYARPYGPGS